MKVIFAGTPEFAAVALQALHEAGFEIPLVLTCLLYTSPSPRDRG